MSVPGSDTGHAGSVGFDARAAATRFARITVIRVATLTRRQTSITTRHFVPRTLAHVGVRALHLARGAIIVFATRVLGDTFMTAALLRAGALRQTAAILAPRSTSAWCAVFFVARAVVAGATEVVVGFGIDAAGITDHTPVGALTVAIDTLRVHGALPPDVFTLTITGSAAEQRVGGWIDTRRFTAAAQLPTGTRTELARGIALCSAVALLLSLNDPVPAAFAKRAVFAAGAVGVVLIFRAVVTLFEFGVRVTVTTVRRQAAAFRTAAVFAHQLAIVTLFSAFFHDAVTTTGTFAVVVTVVVAVTVLGAVFDPITAGCLGAVRATFVRLGVAVVPAVVTGFRGIDDAVSARCLLTARPARASYGVAVVSAVVTFLAGIQLAITT